MTRPIVDTHSPGRRRDACATEAFLAAARRRILIADGGLGTTLRELGAPEGGCPERLNETHPELIARAHRAFLEAGAELITTNSFGGARHILEEHGLGERCFELNRKAAEIARRAADVAPGGGAGRHVAGSIGPGSRLVSLGQIPFVELTASCRPQIEGLIAGGVDCLIAETFQDLLALKAVLAAADEAFEALGRRLPVIAHVTLDEHGHTLLGSDIAAVLAALEPLPVAAIGVNCGLGPEGLSAAVHYLARHSSRLLSVMPNAGLPALVGGRAVYDLAPEAFGAQMRRLAAAGLNVAGGCCGTGPAHVRALARALRGLPARQPPAATPRVSSLFSAQAIDVRPKPLICGERTNASGSRRFRALLAARDFEAMVRIAREQGEEGAHLIDLSIAAAGSDERTDMADVCRRLNTQFDRPVMIDSRAPRVVETALQHLAGRCLVNSVSLEDAGRAAETIALCRRYGAALVLLTIDEQGMAMTAARKLEVAERLYALAVEPGGLAPESLFFDFLTFTLGSGEASLRGAARETLLALRRGKRHFPRSFTLLGLSNVSHGLAPEVRRVLNSVFLQRAVEHGLDAAILHAGRIMPLEAIDPAVIRLCDALIFDRASGGTLPLARLLAHFERRGLGRAASARRGPAATLSPADRLQRALRDGDAAALIACVQALRARRSALSIIERDLLPGMARIGELFETGRMQLPFVLRSAEAMRAALDLLRPDLGEAHARGRGRLVLATVRGDVHDIGKNLVDMLLSSNGFEVVNLGVRQTAEQILAAVRTHRPDAIGLSGLLVESARAMAEYLRAFADQGVSLPVLCGGAALTPKYVEHDLRPLYPGPVHYARDAMEGLRIMSTIARSVPGAPAGPSPPRRARVTTAPSARPDSVRTGRVALARYEKYLDRETLFRRRWQMLGPRASPARQREAARTLGHLLHGREHRRLWQGAMVQGLFRARVEGETLVVIHLKRMTELAQLAFSPGFIRRARRRHGGEPFPVALQLVTLGERIVAECRARAARGDIHGQFLLHGLAAELTEALAEHGERTLARRMRWRRTVRYSPGYPIWPKLSQQRQVFALLRPERIGVSLAESHQMVPEYSTSAIVLPES